MTIPDLNPGQRVRIEQTIRVRDGDWKTNSMEGEVVSIESKPTGSWFAHGKNDKLWLMRLPLRRDDGELVDLIIDPESRVAVVNDAAAK